MPSLSRKQLKSQMASLLQGEMQFAVVSLLSVDPDGEQFVISRKLFWTLREAAKYAEWLSPQLPQTHCADYELEDFNNVLDSERLDSLDELYL